MARPKLYQPDQSWPVWSVLWLYELCASLKLAVLLILGLAVFLAVATVVESTAGGPATRYYVYQSNLFLVWLGLLGLNIFCAAAIRYPWKRYQTGFVVTHVGLLTLLAGSAFSFVHSINSQMLVYQGDQSSIAIDLDAPSDLIFSGLPERSAPLRVEFHPGPLNWHDQEPWKWARPIARRFGIPWQEPSTTWQHPPEKLFEDAKSGLKLEVVDYYSRCEELALPYVGLTFRVPSMGTEMPVKLQYQPRKGLKFVVSAFGGIGEVQFSRTSSANDVELYQQLIPERTVDGKGAVIVAWDGEVYHLPLSQLLLAKEQGEPVPVGDRWTVSLQQYIPPVSENLHDPHADNSNQPAAPAVLLAFQERLPPGEAPASDAKGDAQQDSSTNSQNDPQGEGKNAPKGDGKGNGKNDTAADAKTAKAGRQIRLYRLAQYPFYRDDPELPHGFGVEFYHPAAKGRIDILEGPGHKLYYRAWQQKVGRVVAHGLMEKGDTADTWSMGDGKRTWQMTVDDYRPRPSEEVTSQIYPLPFDKEDRGQTRRVKVRASWPRSPGTAERESREVWLRLNFPLPWVNQDANQVEQIQTAAGDISCEYRVKQVDTGFTMRLDDFDLRVDPGSPMASNYTSIVSIVDVRDNPELTELRAQMRSSRNHETYNELEQKYARRRDELVRDLMKLAENDILAHADQNKHNRDQSSRQHKLYTTGYGVGKNAVAGTFETNLNTARPEQGSVTRHIITMNAPLDYPDPQGRTLRFFQENYGPPSDNLPLNSVFRCNYDPGRWIKYLGSLLITVGIFLMFYMRAYFFKPMKKVTTSPG